MRAFSRAPTEPVDAEGRRYIKRCQDDSALISRVGTWPPRDELADDLSGYDQHWKQVRKSQSKYKNQEKAILGEEAMERALTPMADIPMEPV
ncbi:hypothetical protein B0T17DRAFT_649637 [Bombardia bombarda]|uniref:Uncharacterized protein n=1 Tax=Bombardia bombarda TaxID=252184 RepID=A0AA39XI38_9PEZI|nr:hypothetical protein B0T17DRAFT_649637 [Bombardia bombarda]